MILRLAMIVALATAAPAWAQQSADPIDALLRPPAKDADPEEPDTAATGSAVEPDPDLPPGGPVGPQPYRPYTPPRPVLTTPVFVQETGRSADAPPTPAEAAYDSRLKSSAASVQGFQGPMDGGWTLSSGGQPIYAFQLVDKSGTVEGAWRDLRRAGSVDGSGFFDIVERTSTGLTFRFSETLTAVLHPTAGGWSGQLTEGGRHETVSLARRVP